MTACPAGPRLPGTTLLEFARLLFDEPLVAAVIEPTIADLQRELAAAGSSRRRRVHARWQGYRAFWTVVIIVSFAPWAIGAADAAPRPAGVHVVAGMAILTLVTVVNPVLGAAVAVVGAAGGLCAMLLHAWYERHPSEVPTSTQRAWRAPQINFSSTDVAANGGGLIFVVGSVFVVVLALPSVLCFLLAGVAAGCLLARGLVEWRGRHAEGHLPETRLRLR